MTKKHAALLCESNNSVLLIIDMQERLSSAMPINVLQQIKSNCQLLLQAANLLDIPVIISEQYPKGLGSTLAEIKSHLTTTANIKEKICFSCASNDEIASTLQSFNKKHVIIVGMEAHVCILQTAIELIQKEYQVFVAVDAICSRKTLHFKNALQRLQQAHCVITNAESICFEWLRDAKHDQFKSISKLLK